MPCTANIFSFFLVIMISALMGYSLTEASCPSDADKSWSYDYSLENGPQNWGNTFKYCSLSVNKLQSPINIRKSNVKRISDEGGLTLTNYDVPLTKALFNNTGYTVKVTPTDGVERSVVVNDTSYPLIEFILHFGKDSYDRFEFDLASPGSDHRVDNHQYSMEIQFIHGKPGGRMVIVSALLEQSGFGNPVFERIFTLDVTASLFYKGDYRDKNDIEGSPKLSFFISSGNPYYAYTGSLSFPPCTPNVYWMIKKERFIISYHDYGAILGLRSVEEGDPNEGECPLYNTFRKPQPLNGRTVYSFE